MASEDIKDFYIIDTFIREKLSKCNNRLATMDTKNIWRLMASKVESLTKDKMVRDGYSFDIEIDERPGSIEWFKQNIKAMHCGTDFEEAEQLLQIMRLFNRTDIVIDANQAYYIWSEVSEQLAANWLGIGSDEDVWVNILRFWVSIEEEKIGG